MYGFFSFDAIIQQWQAMGIFTVFLPFILIFVIVYAIVDKLPLFSEKSGISAIISLAVALFGITNQQVGSIMMYLFQNVAIGITILLVLSILLLFFFEEKNIKWLGGLIAFSLFLWAISKLGYFEGVGRSGLWAVYGPTIAFIVFMIIVVVAAIAFGRKEETKAKGWNPKALLKGMGFTE